MLPPSVTFRFGDEIENDAGLDEKDVWRLDGTTEQTKRIADSPVIYLGCLTRTAEAVALAQKGSVTESCDNKPLKKKSVLFLVKKPSHHGKVRVHQEGLSGKKPSRRPLFLFSIGHVGRRISPSAELWVHTRCRA